MRYLLFAFAAMILDVMPVGCESCISRNHHEDSDEVSVSVSSIKFDEYGDSKNIEVKSNTTWKVSGYPSWLTINPIQGKRNGEISVTAARNKERTERSGMFLISAGDASAMVVVRQSGIASRREVVTQKGE